MKRNKTKAIVSAAVLALAMDTTARGALSFFVDPDSPWPSGWYAATVANMQTTVNEYNAYGDFGNGSIYVYYNAGIPTAQSGYGGSGGSIGVGGTYPNVRVLLHESSHWLGTGTYSAYWTGPHAGAILQQFDGVGAILNGDTQHYWPYGENYDVESSPINDLRHVAMVYALREDFGIGSTAAPSSATSVTLTSSDSAGASGFNYSTTWSDGHFPQAGTSYSTGNFTLRTPLDSNTPTNPTPSFTFAGDSLTVNNTNGINGGLLFNGVGTSSVLTFKNLNLNGGYVRHAAGSGDLFQIAGKVTLSASPTIDAAQGNINVLANVGGSGSLTKAGGYTLTLGGTNNYSGDTAINGGTLRLSPVTPVASYTFDNVSGSTVVNGGSGGAGMNGTLANGATVVGGGQSGNAVSLAGGASVDINSPIADLGTGTNWTVSAWIKTATAGASLLTKSNGSGWSAGNTILYLGDGTGPGSGGIPSAVRWGGGFTQGSTGATNVANNAWHQVTYVNNAGTYAIYVDGALQSLSAGNSSFGSGDIGSMVRLGVTTDNVAGDGTVNFNGLMDNVQFYTQSLSSSQVSTLYQGGALSNSLPSTTNVSIVSGAALDVNGVNQTIGSLTGATGSAVKIGAGQLTMSSAASTSFAGVISGAGGSLVKNGAGVLTLSNVNTYTGATTILGGTLRLTAPSAVSAATPLASYSFSHLSGNTVINDGSGGAGLNGTLNLNGGTGSISAGAGPAAGMGALVLNGNGTTVDINSGVTDLGSGSNWTVSAWIKTTQAGATILNKGDGSSWNSGFSTFYLGTGTDAGSGGLPDAVRWGGGWLAGSTPVNDGKWHLLTFTDLAGTKSIYVDGALESLSQSQFLNTDTGSKIRIGFAPTNVDGEVPTSGSLSGINIFNTALSASQIAALYSSALGANMPLPASTPVTIASGATLDINGVNQTIASLTGSVGSNVTLGGSTLTVGVSTSTTFAGVISGTGNLNKQGAGTFTLSGANTCSGSTNVVAGTLTLDAAGSLASTNLTTQSGATLNINGNLSATPDITSTGIVNFAGNASTIVSAACAVGAVVVNAGGFVTIQSSAVAGKPMVLTAAGLTFSNASAALDLTNNELIVTDTLTNVRLEIIAGSLKTSTAGLGVGSLDLGDGTIEARATLLGDTNLDGTVNVADLGDLATNFGLTTGASWTQGDFDYNGTVNVADLGDLATNFGQSLAAGSSTASGALSASVISAVPEPTGVSLLTLAAIGLFSRRRRD